MSAINRAVARWTDPATRPLFKGSLIDRDTGCMCAQGDVLFNEGGYTAEMLYGMAQEDADTHTMRILGISRAHSVLLRSMNDKADGSPQNVLTDPASVIGDKADLILAFWRHLDGMTPEQWSAAGSAAWSAARSAAGSAAESAAESAARSAAWSAAGSAAWSAARSAAGSAAESAARSAAESAAWSAARSAAWSAAESAARSAAGSAAESAARSAAGSAAESAARSAAYATSEIMGSAILVTEGRDFYFLKMFGFTSLADIPA
jgi:hypothetical protein